MRTFLADAQRGHRGLLGFALTMAVLTPVLVVLTVVDPRTVLGAPLWLKPLKFAISFVAYGGTLAWMLGQLPRPALRRTGWFIVAASIVEMVIITGQAARGQLSHFNFGDALGSVLYSVMGGTILVLYVCTFLVAYRFLREPSADVGFAHAIRVGLGLNLLGMAVGVVMVLNDAHTVGRPDGGPGLPIVGWSTVAGDLRAAHFVGLHGLQVLPLLAAALTVLATRWSPADRLGPAARRRIVSVAAVGYAGVVVLLTIEALAARPVLSPGVGLSVALLVLVVGVAAALVGVVRTAGPGANTASPATVDSSAGSN